ncbi:MAG: 30S ribosomal protein S16 [Rickettsiales bacterium]|jgi:small subunit ribosomal protein S16|nr:30S ribosomal protein S16 [Rickettsiales bacterium]
MAVVIRLARHGAKKHPFYHIVVTDSRNARDSGCILERIGSYDPMIAKDSGKRVVFDAEKAKSWMAKGAKPSDRVYKFLAIAGLLTPKAAPTQTKKNQPSEKTLKKLEDRKAKLAKAEEAKAAAIAPKAEAEAPVEQSAEVAMEPVADAPAETTAESAAE